MQGGTETILLIEDEEMLAELVKGILETNGYKFSLRLMAKNISLCQYRNKIACVITDLGLPRLSGDEISCAYQSS